jgi:hypothetical protein
LPLWLIDREVGTTLKRAWHSVGFWQRFGLLGGLLASVFEREEIDEKEIEKLKQGDMLESAFSEFASESAPLYRSLIGERDAFMAARLREEATRSATSEPRRVLVVIGAGTSRACAKTCARTAGATRPTPSPNWPPPRPRHAGRNGWLSPWCLLVFARLLTRSIATPHWARKHCATGCCSPAASPRSAHWLQAGIRSASWPRSSPHRSNRSAPAFPPAASARWPKPGCAARAWRLRNLARRHRALERLVEKPRRAHLLNFFLVSLGTIIGEYSAGIHIFKSLF